MAIVFPSSPSVGQTFTADGKTWQWTGSRWSGFASSTNINADTVDGLQASQFVRSDTNDQIAGVLTANALAIVNGANSVTRGIFSDGTNGEVTVASQQYVTALFDTDGNGSGGFYVKGGATDPTNANTHLTVMSNGNVGIGTASPGYKLDFAVGDTIRLRHAAAGSAIRIGASDYDVNLIRFDGSSGQTDNSYYGGALRYMGSRAGDANSLSIFMDAALGTEVEAMTIRQSGAIGIGTASPTSKLTIEDGLPGLASTNAGNVSIIYQGGDAAGNRGGGIDFRQRWWSGSTDIVKTGMISGYKTGGSGIHGGGLAFWTKPHNGSDLSHTMTLSGLGRVGILATSPAGTLHVGSGDIVFGSGGEQPGNGNTNTGAGFRDVNDGNSVMFSVSRNDGNTCRFNRNGIAGANINMAHDGSTVGSIDTSTSGTTYNTTSDRRLKENIELIADGKEKLLAMKPSTFNFIADETNTRMHGFIAQDMQAIVPEAVSGETTLSMDYGRITPVIVAALQDALKEIEKLKTRINALENR